MDAVAPSVITIPALPEKLPAGRILKKYAGPPFPINAQNASELSRRSHVKRAERYARYIKEVAAIAAEAAIAAIRKEAATIETIRSNEPFVLERISRTREQIDRLDSLMMSETDPNKIDRLASAIAKLADVERVLVGRPLPGTRRPTKDTTKVALGGGLTD